MSEEKVFSGTRFKVQGHLPCRSAPSLGGNASKFISQEGFMVKMGGVFRSEGLRLSKKEMNKVLVPLGRDVWSLKKTVSQLRKTVLALERIAERQRKQYGQEEAQLTAVPEEIKKARISPRLIQALRKRLGLSQREQATLSKVTVGAVHQWETGKFVPKDEKKGFLWRFGSLAAVRRGGS